MINLIFSDFGIEAFESNGKFFVRYDSGEIASDFQESEITKDELIKLQKSENDAYEVLLACQTRQSN